MNESQKARRKNTSIAYNQCRERKRKCNGALPICAHCDKQARECVYGDGRSTKNRRPQNSERVQQLEREVEALRAHIKLLQDSQGVSQAQHTSWPGDSINSGGSPNPEVGYGAQNDSDGSSLNGDEADHGDSRHPQTQSGRDDHLQRLPSAMDEISNLIWTLDINDSGDMSFQGPSGNGCFPKDPTVKGLQLPALDAQINTPYSFDDLVPRLLLLEIFRNNVNPFHFFCDTLPDAAIVMDPANGSTLANQLLAASIISAGSVYANHHDLSGLGHMYLTYSENIVLTCCRHCPSLSVLRSLAILSWIYLSRGDGNMGFMYNYMAGAFWPCFLVDRIATSLHGRCCAINFRRIRSAPFSSAFNIGSMTMDEQVFNKQCELWNIHDKYMDQIYAFDFANLPGHRKATLLHNAREELGAFFKGFSESRDLMLSASQPMDLRVVALHLSYHTSVMLIHRPFIRMSEDNPQALRALSLEATTISAATLTRIMQRPDLAPSISSLPFFTVHHVLTAGICHLSNVTAKDSRLRRTSTRRVKQCVKAIEQMAEQWTVRAGQALSVLRELAARWKVVWALPMHLSTPLAGHEPQEYSLVATGQSSQIPALDPPMDDTFALWDVNVASWDLACWDLPENSST